MNPDLLKALIEAASQKPAMSAQATAQPDALDALLAALVTADQRPPVNEPIVAPLSPIDNALGGQALAGKKTALAIVMYVVLSLLQANDVVGYATEPEYKGPTAAPTATAPKPLATHAGKVTAPTTTPPKPATGTPAGEAGSTYAAAEPAPTSDTTENGRTPTGVTLTTLILAFGALGFLAKIDRGIKAMSLAAGIEPA